MTRTSTLLIFIAISVLGVVYISSQQPNVGLYAVNRWDQQQIKNASPAGNTSSGKHIVNTPAPPFEGGGTIELPDEPETQGYAPSSIKDFEAADPTTGISMISVPSANSLGNAVMNFNMHLPHGRQGLEPGITISYNNEGGPTWMGTGWNLTAPAIGIDTRWGVPRYDAAKETEMYTLNGDQLAPVNNRDTLVARVAEKRFYGRVENDFHKIIRHGDNPKNYWWEVDEKNGRKNYYGGQPGPGVLNAAVLKDDDNNIAYWGLVETVDLYGNFVRYEYDTVQNTGVVGGTVMGRQLYLSHIYYTGNGTTDGPYKLDFTRDRTLGEATRRDVTIDARQGFKMVTADLLRKVKISFNGDLIRSYEFSYTQGAFYKTLLKSIKELDNKDSVFYHQDFDYYDDVRTNLNDSDYKSSDTGRDWQVPGDNIKGDLVNQLPGFEDNASVIGASTVDSKSGGVVVTVGTIIGDVWSKNMSAGGGPMFGKDELREITSLIDINGDGLPDKVFLDNDGVYYRPNLGAGTHSFGERRQVLGINTFGTSTTQSIGGGVQALPEAGFFGYIHTDATTTSKIYFSDFNGDGLIDVASGGTVYFNHINAQGDPEFTQDSKLTPSPILPGGIDPVFLQKDTALQSKQELNFPLQDIIRFWEAPDSGFINITAPVALQDVPNPTGSVNNKKDGVRVSIQLRGGVLWSAIIGPADFAPHNPTGVTGLRVAKGDRVYFRMQSIYNGEDDLVSWDPLIQYTTSVTAQSDVQHKASNHYKASEDFIVHSRSVVGMGKPGSIIVDGTFKKQTTSDSIFIEVTRDRAGVITNFFEKGFSGNDTFDGVIAAPGQLAVDTGDRLHFALVSRSYTDRSAIRWVPHYAFVTITDGTPVATISGGPTLEGFPIPDNSNFNYWQYAAPPVTVAQEDTVTIWPQVPGGGSGTLWFSIKGNDTVYARRKIIINGGTMSTAMDSIHLVRKAGEPLFMEFATDTFGFAATLAPPSVQVFSDSTYTDSTGAVKDTSVLKGSIAANLYCNPQVEYLGAMYRGWGAFAFKGDKGNGPIDETTLNLNEFNSYPTDPNAFTDSTSQANQPDPSKANFQTLFPDILKQEWVGYDTSVYITAGYMSSSRLYMHDVSVDSLGAGAGAINKVSKTSINSYALGISAGGFGPSGGKSDATTNIVSDMMDMNGDRYPDVINQQASLASGSGQAIQYTLPSGGLGNTTINQDVGPSVSSGNQLGIGFGGEFEKAFTGNKTQKAATGAENVSKAAMGISGSINENYDATSSSWVDINGDGLPDRIFDNGNVMLNLGYKFAPLEPWQVYTIDGASSFSKGGGLGVNINGGSFEGGVGFSRTDGRNSSLFTDMNGDGLPDQLILSGSSSMSVRFNTGNGFSAPIPWKNFDDIASLASIGESYNLAFTIAIDIPIIFLKIAINPDANIGHGTSRQEKAWIDLDGDGFADYVQSQSDGQLYASSSAIGRTNMLSRVTSPIGGGFFTVDYQRVGNTYSMPQSKWVLKGVSVFDGVTGDGVDTMRKQFIYEGGYQDRNEREFYGFHQVTTLDLNTANQNKVYRSHIQQFYNSSYYNKGLLASEWIQDSAGHKFTQSNYTYDMRPLEDSVVFPALVQTEKLYYEGAVTADVKSIVQYDYDELGNITSIKDAGDGSQQDMKMTAITYHDNDALYIKSIPSSVSVTTAEGEKRKRTTTLNAKYAVANIKDYLEDGSSANTDIEYDPYGNITKLTKPANYKNQRMSYALEYDNTVHGYPTKITDAWGNINTTEYDYKFGEVIHTTSRNNEETRFTLDNLGRIIKFIGPYEIASGKPYTIAIDYHPEAKVPYTITHHFDPEYNDDIDVYNFEDGLGRSIQLKKQVSIFAGKDTPDSVKMVVSGTSVLDAFGRVEKQYYPGLEPVGTGNANLNEELVKLQYSDTYDAIDRLVKRTLADNATTTIAYTASGGFVSKLVTDALGHKRETLFDQRGRRRALKVNAAGGILTTRFDYDALNEMIKATDTKGNILTAAYDNLGMRTSVNHPDAGRTDFQYDLAGNLLKKITAQVRHDIPNGGAIQYSYDYDRVTDIDYPRNYQNKVKYTYGAAGTGSKAGRVILQEDASGGQEFFYSMQGQVVKVIRTVLTSPQFSTTYVSEQQYDSWNRLKKMVYPDGEQIFYHYNKSGGLLSMDGAKIGSSYEVVNQVGYDEYDERVYMRYANGTENFYNYDDKRRRLAKLRATSPTGTDMMNNTYQYDEISNLLGVVNSTQAPGGSAQNYIYDELDRLDSASGQFGAATKYGLKYAYDNLGNIVHKTMDGATSTSSYDHSYTYGASSPHQATQIGTNKYKYDSSGNQLGYGDIENYFDEENRLMAVVNKGVLCQYSYDADDNRVVKSSGGMQNIWVNGAPAGAVNHGDNYTVYVSPYVVAKKSEYTKHYYIDGQRVASQLGHGTFTNISFPTSGLTAGGVNYTQRAALIEKARNDYYASLGVSPGPPTDKNFWAQPQNSGIAAPVFVDTTASNVPTGWPGNTTTPPIGPPVFVDTIPGRDSVKAGYGFQDAGHFYEGGIFFYHFDDEGSTAFVTDFTGKVVQHVEYAPSGESILSEQNGSFATVYLFMGKGYDEETGYYFFGPQYYDPVLSQWLNILDPSGEGFLGEALSGYGQAGDLGDEDEEMVANPDIEEIAYSGSRETENEWAENKAKHEENESKEKRRQSNRPRRGAIANKYSNMLTDLKYSHKEARKKDAFHEMMEESVVLDGEKDGTVFKGGANIHNGKPVDIESYDGEDGIDLDDGDVGDYDMMGNAKPKAQGPARKTSIGISRSNSRYSSYGIGLLRKSISNAPVQALRRGSSAADVIIHRPSAVQKNSLSRNNSSSIRQSTSKRW